MHKYFYKNHLHSTQPKGVIHTHRTLLLSFAFLSLFCWGVNAFAISLPYTPGATLDPSCAPGTTNCTVTPMSIGASIGNSPSAGSILFANSSGALAQDNPNLFYDAANQRLGVGTNTPGELLSLGQSGTTRGVLSLAGDTSGKVILQPASAAGNWTMTLPTTAGDNQDTLQTDGTGVTTWVKPNAIDASQYHVGSDSQNIQAAVNDASSSGIDAVVIKEKDSNNDPWLLDSAILLPSNMTVYIDNADIKLSDSSRDNFFRSNNIGFGITSPTTNTNIHIIGVGNAILEGADNPRATGDDGKALTLGNDTNYTSSYGTDAGVPGQTQTGDWRDWGIFFGYVENFSIDNITIKNPHGWAINLERSDTGSVENITFDSNGSIGGHTVRNQDGIDMQLGCYGITIKNISGQTGDDMVAAIAYASSTQLPGVYGTPEITGDTPRPGNADDIRDITIDNVHGYSSSSLVRLLGSTGGLNVYNISISNIKDNIGSNPVTPYVINLNSGYGTTYGHVYDVTVNNVITGATDAVYVGGSLVNSSVSNVIKTNSSNTHSPLYFAPGNQGYANVTMNGVLIPSGAIGLFGDPSGNVGIGTATPTHLLDVNGDSSFEGHIGVGGRAPEFDEGLGYSENINITDNTERKGIISIPFGQKTTAAFTNDEVAISGLAYINTGNTQNWTSVLGLIGTEGTTRTSAGSSGTITGAASLVSTGAYSNTGAFVTNHYGLYVQSAKALEGGGVPTQLTNDYGIYIQNPTGGSALNYSIYSEGGLNYFGGATKMSTRSAPLTLETLGISNTNYQSWPALTLEGNHFSNRDGSNLGMGIDFNMSNALNNNTYATVAMVRGVMLSSTSGSETGELLFYTKKSSGVIGSGDVRMTIDNLGNVGIGSSSQFQVNSSGAIAAATGITSTNNITASNGLFLVNSFGITDFVMNSTGTNFGTIQNDAGNVWSLAHKTTSVTTLGTPVLSWTATNKVGIGVIAPLTTLETTSATASGYTAYLVNTDTSSTNGVLQLGVGTVSNPGNNNVFVQFNENATAASTGTVIGSIKGDGAGSVSYSSTSDARLKENIIPTNTGLNALMNIQVKNFNFIGSNQTVQGFIAQNLETVYPFAVTTNGDNGIDPLTPGESPWMVDYGRVTPLIVQSIQDLNLKVQGIDSLDLTNANSIGSMIKTFFADAGNGITDLYAGVIHSDTTDTNTINTKELCVGSTCVTESQFIEMVNSSHTTSSIPSTLDSDSNSSTSATGPDNSSISDSLSGSLSTSDSSSNSSAPSGTSSDSSAPLSSGSTATSSSSSSDLSSTSSAPLSTRSDSSAPLSSGSTATSSSSSSDSNSTPAPSPAPDNSQSDASSGN